MYLLKLRLKFERLLVLVVCYYYVLNLFILFSSVGGGAFANRDTWIVEAIQKALTKYKDHDLDVFLVHYGQVVKDLYSKLAP